MWPRRRRTAYATGAEFAKALQNYSSLEVETAPAAAPIVNPVAPAAAAPSPPVSGPPTGEKPAPKITAAMDSTVAGPPTVTRAAPAAPRNWIPLVVAAVVVIMIVAGVGAIVQ